MQTHALVESTAGCGVEEGDGGWDALKDFQCPFNARFDYPEQFTTMPEYSAHRGQVVTVLRRANLQEADGPEQGCDQMYWIRALDGWLGMAFSTELVPLVD